MQATVILTSVRATEDEMIEACGMPDYSDPDVERIDVEADGTSALVLEAARVIFDRGLTEDNGHWFSDPDGTHIVDYSVLMREETTATVEGVDPYRIGTALEVLARSARRRYERRFSGI